MDTILKLGLCLLVLVGWSYGCYYLGTMKQKEKYIKEYVYVTKEDAKINVQPHRSRDAILLLYKDGSM